MRIPDIKITPPGPRAQAIVARDNAVVSPSYPRCAPLVMARGEGAAVEDVDGNVYLDFAAGIAVTATGHSHPEVVRAITDQASRFLHSSTDYYHEPQVALGEKLAAVAPVGGRAKIFFSNSGTEAVESAIKLARHHTRRFNIIAFTGSFHGRTLGSLALTSSKTVQRSGFGPMGPGVFHAPYANPYRCPIGSGLDANACARECLAYLERQILAHLVSPDEVAAIVVEPIQGEGGYIVPPPEFLPGLAAICAKHGMLFVVDEVQSGIGRTGRMFAVEHTGVVPDIIIAAKGIASGLPMGATIAREDVMDWPVGAHANTFGGNPVACAAALATLSLVQNGLMQNAATVGDYLLHALGRLSQRHRLVGDVRGRGLMIGIELVRDRQSKTAAPSERDALVMAAFRRGLLVLGAGASTIRLSPPLIITKDHAETAVGILDESLAEISNS